MSAKIDTNHYIENNLPARSFHSMGVVVYAERHSRRDTLPIGVAPSDAADVEWFTVDDARALAQMLIMAADWLDAQNGGE